MEIFKIVADSSADIKTLDGIPFASAPLKIITSEKEYIDNQMLNTEEMVKELSQYKGRSSTSQPSLEDWLNAFGEARYVFCITITSALSGCYNSALTAKSIYESTHPDRKVFIFDSLSTGPEMLLIIEKIAELIKVGKGFDEITTAVKEYSNSTRLLFMLQSMKNLANNGRVKPIVAKAAGLLGIRVVGKASDKGELEPLEKPRGEKKAIETIFKTLQKLGYKGAKIRIAHCFNLKEAENLKEKILDKFPLANITIYPCGGLCSFYAEKGGLLIGFETL